MTDTETLTHQCWGDPAAPNSTRQTMPGPALICLLCCANDDALPNGWHYCGCVQLFAAARLACRVEDCSACENARTRGDTGRNALRNVGELQRSGVTPPRRRFSAGRSHDDAMTAIIGAIMADGKTRTANEISTIMVQAWGFQHEPTQLSRKMQYLGDGAVFRCEKRHLRGFMSQNYYTMVRAGV